LKFRRETKIGIVLVVTVSLFIWGFNFLNGKDFFSRSRTIYAVYDKVEGLVTSNPVFVKGVKVGIVKDVFFVYKPQTHIIVKLSLTSDIPIPHNSIAKIYSYDLMGSKAITIELGNSALMVQNGDTLPSLVQGSLSEEVNRQVQPLKKKAEDLMLSVDSVVTVIRAIFNKNTRENLSQSFESIKNTLANLEHTTYNLDTLVGTQRNRLANIFSNIESISGNLRANNEKITNLIRNFSALSDTLGQSNISNTLLNANKAVNDFALVMEKINRGDGTLGLLVNDNKLYNQIDGAARQLQELVDDIKRNPNRYVTISVFGRNPNKYPYQPNK